MEHGLPLHFPPSQKHKQSPDRRWPAAPSALRPSGAGSRSAEAGSAAACSNTASRRHEKARMVRHQANRNNHIEYRSTVVSLLFFAMRRFISPGSFNVPNSKLQRIKEKAQHNPTCASSSLGLDAGAGRTHGQMLGDR
jgi:hypothetical protein